MDHQTISAIALGIALAACCGFRIFIPLLIAAIAAQTQWVVLSPYMHWLGSEAAVIIFAVAAGLEVGTYYFPFLDNIIDTFTAPLAVAGGAAARRGSQQAGQAATLATPWQPTTANEEQ